MEKTPLETLAVLFYAIIYVLLLAWLAAYDSFFQMTFGKLMLVTIIFVYGIKKFPHFSFNVFKIFAILIVISILVLNW